MSPPVHPVPPVPPVRVQPGTPAGAARRALRRETLINSAARILLTGVVLLFLLLMLLLPLATVVVEALRQGILVASEAITHPHAVAALRLTLLVVLVAVPCNVVFGIAAAWTITKFDFPGKNILITIIDLPFTVSPVVSGMIFVLLFGAAGLFGPLMEPLGLRIVFAPPGVILATVFVTFPFVARELIPLMQAQGREDEEAAVSLGAGGWQVFRYVTLPNIRWGLLYGVILCTARAMGEFGAVSVVSGHIRGRTNTLPLHVEALYNEFQFSAAFAVSGVLMGLAVLLLIAKRIVEARAREHTAPVRSSLEAVEVVGPDLLGPARPGIVGGSGA